MSSLHANSLSVLADPTRQRIVEMLAASGALSSGEIASRFALSPPAVSQHLKHSKVPGWSVCGPTSRSASIS